MKLNKNVIKVVCFGLIFCVLFLNIQAIVMQKKLFGREKSEPNTNMIGGFYEEPKNSLDVLFIGSSSMFCNVNPLILFKEEGFASYILGTSSQQLEATYFFLKEGLKRQDPKVVVVDIRSIVYSDDSYHEGYNHFVFDYVPFSFNKLQGIYSTLEYAKNDSVVNYLFPIARYHERWQELNRDDLTWFNMELSYPLKGYYARYFSRTADYSHYYDKGTLKKLPKKNRNYLDKIIATCKEENVELLFIKTPMAASWRQDYSDLMSDYLKDSGIPFLDYNTLRDEIGLDSTSDFFDNGKHLNDAGATKVSLHLGQYLKKRYNLPDHRGEDAYRSWNDDWKMYQQDKAAYYLSHETEWQSYLEKLQNSNYTIYLSVKDNIGGVESPELVKQLKNLGLTEDVMDKGPWGYQAIIDKGNVIYEKLADEPMSYEAELNNHEVKLISKGYKQGNSASIQIDQKKYFVNHRGIGIVVYDNVFDEVVDAVTFDLYDCGRAYRK